MRFPGVMSLSRQKKYGVRILENMLVYTEAGTVHL